VGVFKLFNAGHISMEIMHILFAYKTYLYDD